MWRLQCSRRNSTDGIVLAADGKAVVGAETPLVKLAVTPLLTACSSLLRSFLTQATGIDFLLNNVIFLDIQFSQYYPYDISLEGTMPQVFHLSLVILSFSRPAVQTPFLWTWH